MFFITSTLIPSLILTGAGGYESPFLKQFLRWISRYWMAGVQLNQIAFAGFRTSYQLDAQIARFQPASGQYQQQVLVILRSSSRTSFSYKSPVI